MRWAVVAVFVSGCGRIDFDPINTLVVTTAEDRMAGPPSITSIAELPPTISDLSLREALAIAANRADPDRIEFDPRVFPLASPQVIDLGSMLELGGTGTTVDATLRGVVLDVAPGYDGVLVHAGADTTDARLVGLTLVGGTAPRIEIDGASRVDLVDLALHTSPAVGVRIFNTRTAALRATSIDGPAGNAVEVDRSVDVTVEDTTITGTLGDPIFAARSTGLVIQTNTILIEPASTGRGIVLDTVDRSYIRDNFIDPGSAQLIRLVTSSDNEIIGNILDRGDLGVGLFGASANNLVLRNVIVSNPEPIYVESIAPGNRLLHNTLYMSGAIVDGAADTEVANNLEAQQGFVDPAAFDFHLAPGNPAVDAAIDLGMDLLPDRSARYLGAAPDLGAVETR